MTSTNRVVPIVRFYMLALISLPALVTAGGGGEPHYLKDLLGEVSEVQIEGVEVVKTPRPSKVCQEFELDEKEVLFFLDNATLISGQEMEVSYDWYPCWMKGTLRANSTIYDWTISPAGKGVFTPVDSTISELEEHRIYSVCDRGCLDVFPLGGVTGHD